MLPAAPPSRSAYSIRRGDAGWAVYALQAALNEVAAAGLAEDGEFGPATDKALRAFQRAHDLARDGVAGPATQGKLVTLACALMDRASVSVPRGLLRGFALGEGANLLAAVNAAVPGGVDCGPMQLRCYGPPYRQGALWQAFSPLMALRKASGDFISRRNSFLKRAWVAGSHERAGRVAVLGHNWPSGADYYADHGHAPSPDAPAPWVPAGVRFPDGTPVTTRQDWAEFYAVGGKHGEGRITQFVTDWR